MPRDFSFQYAGLLLFMIGDGIETGFLSPYLVHLGFGVRDVSLVFTIYGVAVAAAAWASGLLCDAFGPRRVILTGFGIWLLPQLVFLLIAVPHQSFWLVLMSYGIRGAGYPLLAYGILTLLMTEVRREARGLASGLFWFCFTAGLLTLGTLLAQISLPHLGEYRTLWAALIAVLGGGLLALVGLDRRGGSTTVSGEVGANGNIAARKRLSLSALVPLARLPRSVLLICVVRAINSSATHGIIVFLPLFFVQDAHMTTGEWLTFLEITYLANIIANAIVGAVSDRVSWTGIVIWVGGVGSAATCLLLYWVPHWYGGADPSLVYMTGALFGVALAGYVPLSALAPTLLPENPGLAMSFLNFGAGCSVWIGPLVVYLFLPALGTIGVIIIYSALFLLSSVLTLGISEPVHARRASITAPLKGIKS
ncbi:alpha-ketoglutarate transporter [Neoasaia chiangmaiensis NBRC 101099]|uniref:Uncharacterized protein n=1 Tax=Neoasaia chiangmaiensis TaxID=320497 RepID=A0A1U9KR17_9PROT|nr:RbtT/DalT/CsbX family MFS transporter [Neoasaia chiangmaiensis]AQS88169.1 hypothetical protein A0U93_09710 [Neoasaia chiangmaiensis]GBR39939.1 alpha-ketoglutarate transporter [Neoasaia chiangmaiensis NBRC 101099]GEN14810.1 MFS transporter [Neoasaia chiangmaiensis]